MEALIGVDGGVAMGCGSGIESVVEAAVTAVESIIVTGSANVTTCGRIASAVPAIDMQREIQNGVI